MIKPTAISVSKPFHVKVCDLQGEILPVVQVSNEWIRQQDCVFPFLRPEQFYCDVPGECGSQVPVFLNCQGKVTLAGQERQVRNGIFCQVWCSVIFLLGKTEGRRIMSLRSGKQDKHTNSPET